MAKPVVRKFKQSKKHLIDAFPEAVEGLDMRMIGCHYELGLLSFGKKGKQIFHAQVAEQRDKSTRVSIAPGLSFMKNRDQSEVPESTIERFMDKLNNAL